MKKTSYRIFDTDKPATWVSKYASVTFTQLGLGTPFSGMNEKGLVIEELWLDVTQHPPIDNRPTIPSLQWPQYQLDNYSTVCQVIMNAKKLRVVTIDRTKLTPKNSEHTKLAKRLRKEIQNLMWKYAGIVRNLNQIKKEGIPKLKNIIKELSKYKETNQIIAETTNMAKTSLLILNAAKKRRKTLGCHFTN